MEYQVRTPTPDNVQTGFDSWVKEKPAAGLLLAGRLLREPWREKAEALVARAKRSP